MSLFNILNVSGSAMSAQAQRLNTVASNLANADSATSPTGEAYRAKAVVFEAVPMQSGASAVRKQIPRCDSTADMKQSHEVTSSFKSTSLG